MYIAAAPECVSWCGRRGKERLVLAAFPALFFFLIIIFKEIGYN